MNAPTDPPQLPPLNYPNQSMPHCLFGGNSLINLVGNTYRNYIDLIMSCCDEPHGPTDHQHKKKAPPPPVEEPEELIEGQTEEEKLRLLQLRREKRKAEILEVKKKYLPLLKFLRSNGLKFKTAAVKKNTVEYFRMDHFKGFLEEKKEKIELNATVKQLLTTWQKIFVYYDRVEGQPHLKWPQELENSGNGPDSKFASFPFDSTESSKTMTVLIVVCIFGMVLFPLWPYELKYVLWLVSLWTTLAFVAVIVLRLFTYLLGAILGGSFWIFPRLLDNCGFVESLVPLYSWVWWTGSTIYSVIVRVTVLSLFIYYGYHIYSDPTIIEENIKITQTIIDDINDWGVAKMKGERNFSQSALTDYNKLLNSTEVEDEGDGEDVMGSYRSPEEPEGDL